MEQNTVDARKEMAQQLLKESPDTQFTNEELYQRLVEVESGLTYDQDLEVPTLEIVDDDKIAINGICIAVNTPTKRYFLNKLHLWQGYPLSGPELREDYVGDQSTLALNIRQLLTTIEQVTSDTIIERSIIKGSHGSVRTYELLPEIRVVDTRYEKPNLSEKDRLIRKSVHCNEDGSPMIEGGVICFKNHAYRQRMTARMVRQFKKASGADDQLQDKLERGLRLYNENSGGIQWKDEHVPNLTREEEDALLYRKELALREYIAPDTSISEDERSEIIHQGVRACFDLVRPNLSTVRALAAQYGSARTPFQEIYQACAERLLLTVFREFPGSAERNFKVTAFWALRYEALAAVHYDRLPPVSYPLLAQTWSRRVVEHIEEARNDGEPSPTIAELGEAFSMRPDSILGLMSLRRESVYLDEPLEQNSSHTRADMLTYADDELDAQLNAIELEEAVDRLFTDKTLLTDYQKTILSLHYRVFHPSLRGIEIRSPHGTFVYPYTPESFNELAGDKFELKDISERIFGKERRYASSVHRKALLIARKVLSEYEGLELYGGATSEAADPIEQKQKELIEKALELSPHAPLGYYDILRHSKEGNFVSVLQIKRYFNSIPEFQIACGFESKDRNLRFKHMSNDELIDLAVAHASGGALTKARLMELSRNGDFIYYTTIASRFGTMDEFREALAKRQAEQTGQQQSSRASNREHI